MGAARSPNGARGGRRSLNITSQPRGGKAHGTEGPFSTDLDALAFETLCGAAKLRYDSR